ASSASGAGLGLAPAPAGAATATAISAARERRQGGFIAPSPSAELDPPGAPGVELNSTSHRPGRKMRPDLEKRAARRTRAVTLAVFAALGFSSPFLARAGPPDPIVV